MRIPVRRMSLEYRPDSSRVVARYFMSGEERAAQMINRIMEVPDKDVHLMLIKTLRQFARRHRNISEVLIRHCHNLDSIFTAQGFSIEELSDERKMLIGSYFTMEFAIESAAFFNPSVVEDPVQDGLGEGEKRMIISFRATGSASSSMRPVSSSPIIMSSKAARKLPLPCKTAANIPPPYSAPTRWSISPS